MSIAGEAAGIEEDVLGSVFFLYRTRDVSDRDSGPAGAGFLVRLGGRVYAATSRSVLDEGALHLRMITRSWAETWARTTSEEWVSVAGSDVVIRPFESAHRPVTMPRSAFVERPGICTDDSVVMIGGPAPRRAVQHFTPILRFGFCTTGAGKIWIGSRIPGLDGGPVLLPNMQLLGIYADGSLAPVWKLAADVYH